MMEKVAQSIRNGKLKGLSAGDVPVTGIGNNIYFCFLNVTLLQDLINQKILKKKDERSS